MMLRDVQLGGHVFHDAAEPARDEEDLHVTLVQRIHELPGEMGANNAINQGSCARRLWKVPGTNLASSPDPRSELGWVVRYQLVHLFSGTPNDGQTFVQGRFKGHGTPHGLPSPKRDRSSSLSMLLPGKPDFSGHLCVLHTFR